MSFVVCSLRVVAIVLAGVCALAAPLPAIGADPVLAARDDRVVVLKDAEVIVDVLANDTFDAERLRGGTLHISTAPVRGSALVLNGGDAGTVADDRIRYASPDRDSGEFVLTYTLCEGSGGCIDADVTFVVRPQLDVHLTTTTGRGWIDRVVESPQPWTGPQTEVRFWESRFVAPQVFERALTPDPTPHDVWDGDRDGMAFLLLTLSDSQPDTWNVLVDAHSVHGGDIDLYLGLDVDGDGQPDPEELRCVAAMSMTAERCELNTHASPSADYWVMAHNHGTQAEAARLEVYASKRNYYGPDPQLGLVATGPAWIHPGDTEIGMRLSWRAPDMLPGGKRLAYVSVSGGHPMSGSFPVLLERNGATHAPLVLRNGVAETLALEAGDAHDGAFIDVPATAQALFVMVESLQDVEVYVAHADAGTGPYIAAAPPREAAEHAAQGPGGNRFIEISGTDLRPGRWYITPVNPGDGPVQFTLSADIAGPLASFRSGSYFNPERSGHGFFLYPAGSRDMAGLWYTYLQDGTPVWYYFQGPAPTGSGIFKGSMMRTVWRGEGSIGTYVGHVIATPAPGGALQVTYEIDGETGSETLQPLGRGCPTLGGAPLDASSIWFNPAPASDGTGFSVQMFPNYEFYAAFIYDRWGQARFLLAEKAGFAGADATIPVEQVSGFCPLCERAGSPQRRTVGTLRRVFGAGVLQSIVLEADFALGVEGAWASNDPLQLLGGLGTTQGCEP